MKVTIKRDGQTIETVTQDAATGAKDAIGLTMADMHLAGTADPDASYSFVCDGINASSFGDELAGSATALGADFDAVAADFAPAKGTNFTFDIEVDGTEAYGAWDAVYGEDDLGTDYQFTFAPGDIQ